MDRLQRQRAEMEDERRRRLEEDRRAKEEQASQAEIHRIQEEDRVARMANDTLRAQHAELLASEEAQENRRREDMIARLKQSRADELRLMKEENARLELEQQVHRNTMGRTPSPLPPQPYLAPSFPVPMNPYISGPYSYPVHLLPPQPLYCQPQGGISLQNVSGSHISINSTPPPPSPLVVNNINSGNVSNVSISNTNNNNAKRAYRLP